MDELKQKMENITQKEYEYKKEVKNLKEYITKKIEDKTNRFNIQEIDLDIDAYGFGIIINRSRMEYDEIKNLDKIFDGYELDTIQATSIDKIYRIKIWFFEVGDDE